MDEELEILNLENAKSVDLSEYITEEHDGQPCDMIDQAFALDTQTFNEEDNTIKVRYTNNAKVLRYSWLREEYYYLQLSSRVGHVDLTRLNTGAAVVDSHNTWSLSSILGAVVPGSATEKEATIKFSTRDDVKPIVEDIKAGIIRFVSPGAHIHETKDITKEGEKLKTLLVTKWEPYEISFVAAPADPGAQSLSLRQKVEKKKTELGLKQAKQNKEQNTMDEETKTPASAPDKTAELAAVKAEAEKTAKAEAIASEKARTEAIFSITAKARLGSEFSEQMIKEGKSIEEVREVALNKLAEGSADQEVRNSNFQVGETDKEKAVAATELALMARSGQGKYEQGNKFNNMSLTEMAKFYAQAAGADVDSMSRGKIAEFALHSTTDFPAVLANVANKTIRKSYEETKRTFLPFCRKVNLPDFKPVSRVQVSEIPTPTLVTEGGEFNQSTISDGKETYQLATYGEIISITRQTIINDDLNVFSRIPTLLGSAASRLESDLVYGILTDNPLMADGKGVFHADHGNLTDALLLPNHASLLYYKDFVKLFRNQKGPKGIANLNLYPDFLICGPESEEAGKKLIRPLLANTTADDANIYANSAELIVETRLSDSAFYGAANPNTIDGIEYGYLEGEEGPQITTRNGWEVDGVQIKMKTDFVASAVEYRGLAKSTNDDS